MINDPVVGRRLRIEYADQNEGFAPFLPRTGTVIRRCIDTTGENNWFHFLLDVGFQFQVQLEGHFRFDGIECTEFLLRSRLLGKEIGEEQPTDVFVLLVSSKQSVVDPIDPKKFYHAAWGTSHTLE